MEASVAAGTPASGGGQATQGEQQGQQDGAQADLNAQLTQINQQMEETRQFLQSQPWQTQEAASPAEEQAQVPEVDLSMFDETNPQYDPAQAAQHLQDMIDQRAAAQAEQLVQQHVAPLQEAQEEMRRSRDAEALAAKYPDLQKPEVAQQVIDHSMKAAEMLGRPELGLNPQFWEMNLLNLRALEMSKGEGTEVPGAATLEGAGGASPGAQQGADAADRIVNAGRTSKVLPF